MKNQIIKIINFPEFTGKDATQDWFMAMQWMVDVMDRPTKNHGLVMSIFSQVIQGKEISQRQKFRIREIFTEVIDAYQNEKLEIQAKPKNQDKPENQDKPKKSVKKLLTPLEIVQQGK